MFHSIELKRWYVITTTRASKLTEDLIKSLQQVGRGMNFTIAKPRVYVCFLDFMYFAHQLRYQ